MSEAADISEVAEILNIMRKTTSTHSLNDTSTEALLKRDLKSSDKKTVKAEKRKRKPKDPNAPKLIRKESRAKQHQICCNPACGATESPTWRKIEDEVTGESKPACNACKLYYCVHKIHRTPEMVAKPKKIVRLNEIKKEDRKCTLCHDEKASVWRFVNGKIVCNPCGQYFRRHLTHPKYRVLFTEQEWLQVLADNMPPPQPMNSSVPVDFQGVPVNSGGNSVAADLVENELMRSFLGYDQ